jgi:hypothetical protein
VTSDAAAPAVTTRAAHGAEALAGYAGRLHWRFIVRSVGLAVVAGYALWYALHPWANDGHAYWSAWQGDLYRATWPDVGYVYSPAFAQAIWPLTLAPFAVFWAILVAVQSWCLVAIVGPVLGAALLVVPWLPAGGWANPVVGTIGGGNITLVIAFVAVYGLRYPALWSVALLTKVTPGIGLLWFAVRREWRSLASGLGVTAGVAALSFVIAPHLWLEWAATLVAASGADVRRVEPIMPLTLALRLPIAAALIAWGARTDRRWTVPIGVMLAQPDIGLGGFVVGLGAIYWLRRKLGHREPQRDVGVRVDLVGLRSV